MEYPGKDQAQVGAAMLKSGQNNLQGMPRDDIRPFRNVSIQVIIAENGYIIKVSIHGVNTERKSYYEEKVWVATSSHNIPSILSSVEDYVKEV